KAGTQSGRRSINRGGRRGESNLCVLSVLRGENKTAADRLTAEGAEAAEEKTNLSALSASSAVKTTCTRHPGEQKHAPGLDPGAGPQSSRPPIDRGGRRAPQRGKQSPRISASSAAKTKRQLRRPHPQQPPPRHRHHAARRDLQQHGHQQP